MITLTENVKLVPHFEIDVNDLRTGKKKSRHKIKSREQSAYWEESLKQAGIEDVPSLMPNWWCVALTNIHYDQLYRVILKKLWHTLVKAKDPHLTILHSVEGGVSLFADNELIYQAMCCSDLSNISDWRMAVYEHHSDWEMRWNGHPYPFSRHQNNEVIFTGLTERGERPDDGKYAISRRDLKRAVIEAEKEIADFQKRIIAYWNDNKENI